MGRLDTIDDLVEAPTLPTGSILLQSPPDAVEDQTASGILTTLLPIVGSLGAMVFMTFNSGNPRSLMMGGGMAFAMLSMAFINIYRQFNTHRRQLNTTRREYLAYLAQTRETVRQVAVQQRRHETWHQPAPEALVFLAEHGARVWERSANDPRALQVRIGVTTKDLAMELEAPELAPLANPDAVCLSAQSRFTATHSRVDGIPFSLDLGGLSHLQVIGPPESAKATIRALLGHLAVLTPPATARIAVLCGAEYRWEWEWMKWLPHAGSPTIKDAIGPARMIVTEVEELEELLGEASHRGPFRPRTEDTPWPHLILVVDNPDHLSPDSRWSSRVGIDGVTIVSMPQVWRTITSPTTVRLVIHPAAAGHSETIEINTEAGSEVIGIPDHLGILQAEAIARRLAGMAFGDQTDGPKPQQTADPERSKDLMELLKISDIRQFDPAKDWKHRSGRDRLNVPFGITQTGIPTMIDLKESAEQGMGPHGLMIGATGSGKSEVLRTMVLALALTHSPEQLNLVLVDFKGGATFAGMAQLPHVSAMISNLAAELSLVDRMEEALRGEMNRRQELLRAAGNFANVNDYEAARRAGRHGYPTLPALFIVLDEFSELLSANPEFIDTFVTIGRLGRSMSIHLLLASQRLEEGRLRGLDSHLSYRIGLRTFSGHESRAVLGVEDAYKLPSLPGVGYLKIGSAEGMIRFRASYVAAPPPPPSRTTAATAPFAAPPRVQILPFTSTRRNIQPSSYPEPAIVLEETRLPLSVDPWEGMSELAIAVQRMEGHGQAHQIWLPPLDTPDTFASLMPDLAVIPGGGLLSMETRSKGWLQFPMGTVDVPLEQRREPLVFDLSGAAGNLVVVGAPLTGKSTFLRTLAISLSLTYTPREVQFYILDLGGGTFSPFSKALHVAAVATRDTPDVINRMFAEIEGIMADREAYFRTHGIDSMATYRQGRAEGKYDDGYGDVFVIVDGWTVVRTDFPDLEMRVSALAVRALTFGIHLVFSANRWADVRQALQDVMSSRFELRLGQPHESQVNRRLAEAIPLNRPGRGIVTSKHHALIALPRIDDDPSPATLGQGVINTLQRIADAWQGPLPPKLRLLPEKVTLAELRAQAPTSPQFLIGIEESRLSPLLFNPAEENHLFAFGDGGTGRSNFLRCLAQEIMRTNSPNQAQIYLVDPRRALLGEIPDAYRAGYYTTREAATEGLTALSAYLKNRLPRADVTPAQLRDRSWWTGAEGWILVDDYELIANPSTHPLAALQPLMAQARDLGFHIVVVRRMGGASRAMYDPIIQTMSELGSTGILLPGDPGEGQLIGRHKPMKGVPGRAQVISRAKGHAMAQLAWADQAMD